MISFLTLTTPTNLQEEKDKFFALKKYNPIFHYGWQDDSNRKYTHPDPLKHQLFEAILRQDHEAITRHASRFFEVENSSILADQAKQIIAHQSENISIGSTREYVQLLEHALKEFSLNYQIVISPEHGFNARPNHNDKTIIVSEAMHFELFSMEGEVRHELSHAIRYANGEFNGIKRSPYYLPTEEGLASYMQDNVAGVRDRSRAQHAIEYLGSEIGGAGSLRDIFNFMIESGMSEELAWKRASRHKFGFVDTSKPGDIMKPAMYFTNEIKIEGLNTDEKLRLFVGKIALSELHDHPVYRGRWAAQKLINYFDL